VGDESLDSTKSVKIGERYAIAVDDLVVAKREYRVYHVMDIGKLNGKLSVNLRYRDTTGRLAYASVPFDKFLNKVLGKVLIPLD
jgi:hypothetical protein